MENFTGVIPDPRPQEAKEKDLKHEDLSFGLIEPKWEEKTKFKSYKVRNQDGSLSCVAHAGAKMLGVHEVIEGREYKDLSPKFIYLRRSNYPSGGMFLQDVLKICRDNGSCEEELMPCEGQGETFMNEKSEPYECVANAKKYRGNLYFEITDINIDNIASILAQGYGVVLFFKFDYDEWRNMPEINPNSKNSCHHAVCALDYGLINGKKYIALDDSWGTSYGVRGQRLISEEFLKEKCYCAGYVTSLSGYPFVKTYKLKKPMMKDNNVKLIQAKIGATIDGVFGKETRLLVIAFQLKNRLVFDGIVGPKTWNKLFA